ncbi:MAG: transcriptional repressor LexA [Candidatus Marinimicrobia bacterium]|jgi:repressor LexA|nr:transcriptional repressor LexA [Candidatus Neomarinimicrobiota bacterium]HJM34413.1 transcriptional repressor LexA [Candidatus Neomarinimicrobiota bacterium]HJM96394.1 transcriptional repressor LexA [Candidatus Neomarinimicrobiota bacterium]|tara:strand:+ start:8793 stop:9407 length:615 start_codon:yes stop_codon:yes gene_type:complete
MKPLSPKLKRFLDFIQRFTLSFDQAPSYEEIMVGLGFDSLGTVNWYVKTLEEEGHLSRIKGPNGKRALTLIHKEHATTTARLPLLGLIAAGEPIEALENPEVVDVPPSLLHPDNYVLQVKGDSMIDEQIHDGDFIVARKTKTARSGQIVVALINGEATLKCYVPKTDCIELHPRNPNFPVIKVNPQDDFHINGVLLYSFRNYLN